MKPTIGRIVWYRTDGRNGLTYDLPAIITVTQETHPGDYPSGHFNPLPVPESPKHVHLTVFSPGGFGTTVGPSIKTVKNPTKDSEFVGAVVMNPGSGTYVEWNVPFYSGLADGPLPRTWRWPEIKK